jgi:hypothetical protein
MDRRLTTGSLLQLHPVAKVQATLAHELELVAVMLARGIAKQEQRIDEHTGQ